MRTKAQRMIDAELTRLAQNFRRRTGMTSAEIRSANLRRKSEYFQKREHERVRLHLLDHVNDRSVQDVLREADLPSIAEETAYMKEWLRELGDRRL